MKVLEVIVLAAGQGKRMRSQLAKVLHPLAGRPMLVHVLDTLQALEPDKVHVVVGYQGTTVRETLGDRPGINWVNQDEQKGTGHAVQQALPGIADDSVVLVVYGDVPLVAANTLAACVATAEQGGLGLVTADFADPAELGRIVRNSAGAITEIVEYQDASPEQRAIHEINSGIIALSATRLKALLGAVQPHNAQGEYYLTDIVALAVQDNMTVQGLKADSAEEVTGVNDRAQLATLERCFQRRQAVRLMSEGVTIADPERIDIRGEVTAEPDCFIDINVVLEGRVTLGAGVSIGPGAVIKDTEIGAGVRIEPHTVIEGARIAPRCVVGPFARIRPGTELGEGVKVGNFVELKKANLGKGTKASHLAYLGDATLGENCNVGAGAITCNFDGIDKNHTEIGNDVFVGSNSTLVAPLEIESEAYVAAGSTVTSRVGKGDLAVGRGRQRNIQGWVRPDKRKPKK